MYYKNTDNASKKRYEKFYYFLIVLILFIFISFISHVYIDDKSIFLTNRTFLNALISTGFVFIINTAFLLGKKKANWDLKLELLRYQSIFHSLPTALYTVDTSGVLTFYNEAAAELWGRHPKIGKDLWCGSWRICLPDGSPLPLDQCYMAIALQKNTSIRGVEVLIEKPDGTRTPVLPFPTPIRNNEGKLIGALNMLVDISERRNNEATIERRNKWLKLLSDTSAYLAEADDPETMMHSVFTKTFAHIDANVFFNYKVVYEGEDNYLHLEAAGGIDETMKKNLLRLEFGQAVCGTTAQNRKVTIVNDVQQSKDPKTELIRNLGIRAYICQPLIVNNELLGTLSYGSFTKNSFEDDEIKFIKTIGHYVTVAKKRLRDEKAIKANEARSRELLEQAEAANIAKTAFLANMSHEIRTPMNAIVGLTNILATQEINPNKQKEFLKTMKYSAEHLMELINDILDISKIESEHLELEQIPFDLGKAVNQVITIHKVKADEKDVDLKVEYVKLISSQLIGDPHRIKQILMNLISNAIKFTNKGFVTLKLDYKPINDNNILLIMIVEDTGIGIKQEQLDSIFGKFTQADTSMTRKYGGTGLGLAITKNLVEAMNGSIKATSIYGQGTCFNIELPLTVKQNANVTYPSFSNQKEQKILSIKPPYVLLVEDYPANVMVATTLLSQFGCKYKVAHNGKEALEVVKMENFDIILMDVQMPVIDGFEATRLIRKLEKSTDRLRTNIIGITAHVLAGDRERCLDAGMDDYISKPFDQIELYNKIIKYIQFNKMAV
jgi:PAS domain S-box-containing protein